MIDGLKTFKRNLTVELALLCLFVFTIPFPVRFNNAILLLLAIYWVAFGLYKNSIACIRRSCLIKLFILVFIVIITSSFTSETALTGLSDVEKYLSLLLPVIVCGFDGMTERRRLVYFTFVASCLVCAVYSLISTLVIYDLTLESILSDDVIFSYYSWVLPNSLDLPSNYYSLFIAFSLVIILQEASQATTTNKIILLLPAIVLFVFLALLSSRISFFALVFLVGLYIGRSFLQKRANAGKYVIALLLFTVSVALLMQVPYLKARIVSLTEGLSSDPRYGIFQCGYNIFLNHPFWGVGILDAEAEAIKCYKESNMEEAFTNKYNFHNTFIEIAASTGILGLSVVFYMLFSMFKKALRRKDILHLGFVFLFAAGSLTESLLSRSKGIVFFCFFSTLLFIIHSHEEDTSR